MHLTRDQILSASDLPFEDVTVPEWPAADGTPGVVRVRTMTGTARELYETACLLRKDEKGQQAMDDRRAGLCAFCIVDPTDGHQLFTVSDIKSLSGKSSAALDRIAEAAMRLNRMTREEQVKAGNS